MKSNTTQYVRGIHIIITVTVWSDISLAEDGILQLFISNPALEYTRLQE